MYVCWLACEFVFLWFCIIETKNQTLEETVALFDGGDALDKIAHQATAHHDCKAFEKCSKCA